MTSQRRRQGGRDDRLRAFLREGDPAADRSELSREESAALRRTVLGSVRRDPVALRWAPLGAAAALAVLAAVLLLPAEPPAPLRSSIEAPPTIVESRAAGAARQIRFATEEGTQIIWVLDPDLDL